MINVAIMGYGTIGSGVYEVIRDNNKQLVKRIGDEISVKAILDIRDFKGTEIESKIVHDYKQIVNDADIHVVVETMGGTEPAYKFVYECLEAGKHVVTSNKALVAAYGTKLLELARTRNVNFLFEASVGGGIPIIRTINDAYSGEYIKEITGILNGTTNFILTKMYTQNESFEDALATAQELGYAEKNPEADVEGHDTCRKIAILSSLATGKEVDFEEIYTEGITRIDTTDFAYAKKLGLEIKLFGNADFVDNKLFSYVCPVMIPPTHPLFMVSDVFNGIMVEGNMLGKSMLYGSGAGKLPTASAVVADIIVAAKNKNINLATGWTDEKLHVEDMSKTSHHYLVRFANKDDAFVEQCKKAFGQVEVIKLEGVEEFGVLTGLMREKDFEAVAVNLDGLIKFIRAKLD